MKKLSVITPSYNQGRFLIDCISSVKSQNYRNIEHIIIDGASSDSTLDILKKTTGIKWISEPDNGPAHALNKGFAMATGEVFGWLNSDDYYEENALAIIMDKFNSSLDVKIVTANLTFVDINKNLLLETKSDMLNLKTLIHNTADIVRQPSTFFLNELFYKVGGIDESFKCAFDYDFFIKIFKLEKINYIDELVAYSRDYPDTITRRLLKRQGYEIIKISLKNGGRIFDRVILHNLFRKILGIKREINKDKKYFTILEKIWRKYN